MSYDYISMQKNNILINIATTFQTNLTKLWHIKIEDLNF